MLKKLKENIWYFSIILVMLVCLSPALSAANDTPYKSSPLWSDTLGNYSVLVAVSDDGSSVIAGSDGGILKMYDKTGKIIWTYTSVGTSFSSVSISGDGQIVTANSLVFDHEGNLLTKINNSDSVGRTAVSRNGEMIVSSGTNRFNMFDLEGNILGKDVEPGAIWDVAISGDGLYGAAPVDLGWQTRKGKIVVIDRNGSKIVDYPTMSQGIGIAISSNGSSIVGIDDYNLYSLFRNGTLRWNFSSSPPFRDVAITPDGRYIVAGSQHYLRFFNGTGSLLWQNQEPGYVYSVATSEDGEYIIAGSEDQVRLFDKSGNLIWRYSEGANHVTASKNGDFFAVGTKKEIKFFDKWGSATIINEPAPTILNLTPPDTFPAQQPTTIFSPVPSWLAILAIFCISIVVILQKRG
jgi:hypothetical protein